MATAQMMRLKVRTYVELLDGKYDGLVLDSESSDPIEREFVCYLLNSPNLSEVQRLEHNGEAWIQLRHRRE